MRKIAVLASLLVLVGPALAFEASFEVADRIASPDDPARFLLEVRNTGFEEKKFSVSASPYSYWFYTENSRTIEPGENYTFEFLVTPPEDAVQQNYRFDAAVTAGSQTERFTEFFTVEHENDLVIRSFSSDQDSYRPGEQARLQVGVLNTAPSRIEGYRIRASIGNSTTAKQGLPVAPGSSARLALNLRIPDRSSPGERQVTIEVIRDGDVTQTLLQSVNVERLRRVNRTVDVDNRLLFYTRTVAVTNNGNYPVTATVNETVPDYLKPITSFSPEPVRTAAGTDSTTYTWSFELAPGETGRASYTTDYWIPGAILVLLIGGLLAIRRLRTNLSFTKRARKVEKGIKIHLELENRSGDPVRNITVEDFVPDIASVDEEFPMARPVIRKTSNGTRLTWEIDELEPGSQRVFEYTIHPQFEVEGGVELPAATMESGKQELAETGEVEVEFQPEDT